jgi:hypothetical protein
MGYAKGTPSSNMVESIRQLRVYAHQRITLHPLLLQIIILNYELSSTMDQMHRRSREWLRILEHAISMRGAVLEEEEARDPMMDVDAINRDLAECHAQVLWKRPQAYQEIIKGIYSAMDRFWDRASGNLGPAYGGPGGELNKLHRSILSRLEFYNAKLRGIEDYANVTHERLTIQRAAVCSPRFSTPPPSRCSPFFQTNKTELTTAPSLPTTPPLAP